MTPRAILLCALVLCACGDRTTEPAPEAPAATPDVNADLRALRRLLAEDPAADALLRVDEAVDDDKPIRAAELLEVNAIPAARRGLEEARALATRTPEGATKKRALVEAYEARVSALVAYQRALSRGPLEDVVLLDAVHAYRVSEERVLAVHAALDPAPGNESSTTPPR